MTKVSGCSRSCGGAGRVDPGAPSDDDHGIGVRDAGAGDRRLVAADEDTVRGVIHAFNERGPAALDPQWAGGRPRLISTDDEEFIVATATTRPAKLGRPFTHWSVRRLADYLATDAIRTICIGRERLGQILREHRITFQRTRTWKELSDPDKEVKLGRIEYVTGHFTRAVFRIRPVRADLHPPLSRYGVGATVPAGPAAGDLPSHPRHPLLPRLLLPG